MFSFFKKKPLERSGAFEALRCDMHSHLVPGIDDGSPDMETSIRLIQGLIQLGYKKIITTPHISGEFFPNTPEIIRSGLADVREELRRQQMDVELHAAAEYLMDDNFSKMLSDDVPLLTLKDNMVLVELSFIVPAMNIKSLIFELQLKGYQPVLAHPERYLYFAANKSWYEQLRDAGCLFQINLLSFAGYYGREAQQLAEWLAKKNFVELLGTDMHHERHLEQLKNQTVIHRMADKLVEAGLIRNAEL